MDGVEPERDARTQHPPGEPFPVAVLMACEPVHGNPWLAVRWKVLGVVGREGQPATPSRTLVRGEEPDAQYLYTGFTVALHRDELASYYENLASPEPGVFVVCNPTAEHELRPVHVTLSYDEASAYAEGDGRAFRVPLPPELYRWVEIYVLENYAPEKPRKRKRDSWKEGPPGACPT